MSLSGETHPDFSRVGEAFAANFQEHGDIGAALCVFVGGDKVVDLWGGDAVKGRVAWDRETLCPVFSVSKGVTATVALMLADRGLLDVHARVADYWPEFGENGKADVRVGHLLTHTVGLPWFERYWDLVSFDSADGWSRSGEIADALARSRPLWAPGSRMGYHSFTYGWLVGELCRRITGMTLGGYLAAELCGPLDIDFHIGLPDRYDGRVCVLYGDAAPEMEDSADDDLTDPERVFFVGPRRRPHIDMGNTPAFWHAEVPAANGIATARAVAQLYSVLACEGKDGSRQVVSADAVREHTREWISADDTILGFPTRVGLGYGLSTPGTRLWFGPESASFGFTGMGGNTGFADPVRQLSVGFTVNHWRTGGLAADPRWLPIFDALYAAI